MGSHACKQLRWIPAASHSYISVRLFLLSCAPVIGRERRIGGSKNGDERFSLRAERSASPRRELEESGRACHAESSDTVSITLSTIKECRMPEINILTRAERIIEGASASCSNRNVVATTIRTLPVFRSSAVALLLIISSDWEPEGNGCSISLLGGSRARRTDVRASFVHRY